MGINLYDYQLDAIEKMKNGCILCGGVGSGKSRTALGYYYKLNGGKLKGDEYSPMSPYPMDLYIITTARKRDSKEWELDMAPFLLSEKKDFDFYNHTVTVDSWNNIAKYINVKNAFFIFDEQRVVGKGAWVKSFLKIVKTNQWILLSATPGDTWTDYIPVFIANGFYRNRTEFYTEHVVWNSRVKFPKVERYLNTGRLIRLRNLILVDMEFHRNTVPHHEDVYCNYDILAFKMLLRKRWNPFEEKPIESPSELCYLQRKVVNSDPDRQVKLLELFEKHPRIIVFYSYDYELDILKGIDYGDDVEVAEWNGHKHQPIPESDSWIYLVQYTAGCEAWNCTKTDTIVFFSQQYSYKTMVQASGRIDRLTTPYKDLYYYHFKSYAPIDVAINRALSSKKNFNEGKYANRYFKTINKEN